jgi:hypothetical protein
VKIEVVATVGDTMIHVARVLPNVLGGPRATEHVVRAEVRIAMGELEESLVEAVIMERRKS